MPVVVNVLAYVCGRQRKKPKSLALNDSPRRLLAVAGSAKTKSANEAASLYEGTQYWDKDWRKGGLQERKGEIIKQEAFYNQLWCGCEFSMSHLLKRDESELPSYILEYLPMVRERDERIARAEAQALLEKTSEEKTNSPH